MAGRHRTGAGRGVGRGHALLLAAKGANVVVADPAVGLAGTGESPDPADAVVAETAMSREVMDQISASMPPELCAPADMRGSTHD